MGRSVVLAGAARCPRCSLPPRWCTCGLLPPVETRLAVHVLIHHGEHHKPSSTGRLVGRVVHGAVCHLYSRATRFSAATGFAADTLEPSRELWILHPRGDPPPAHTTAQSAPTAHGPHVLLLDGTWRQAGEMLRSLEGMG
ncbi:MAG: DTW domain-containing protein [Planctomycetia bacterium]